MKSCLIIDEIFLKENSPITANVDMASVFPFARTAQDIYLQEIIGTSLLKYLCELLTASPVTVDAQNQELLENCRQVLVWYTVYDFLPSNWIAIRNMGALKQFSDNTSTIDQNELEYMRNDCLTKATFYKNRLIAFLCVNGSKYEAYNKGCWSCGDISPTSKKGTSVDLFFDNSCDSREDDLLRRAGLKR